MKTLGGFRWPVGLVVALALLVLAIVSMSRAASPTTAPAENVIYSDPTGTTSATITQCLPNSAQPVTTLTDIKRIYVVQEIIVIEWGTTSTTLLPRQYVSAITLNKRAAATQGAATRNGS